MILCGREQEVQQIVADCAVDRVVVVTAASGLGSTALLVGGVAPALQAEGCITLLHRDWQGRNFIAGLKDALASAVRQQADESFLAQNETVTEMLRRITRRTGRPVVLLLDQFEDYVRCHSGTDLSDDFDADLANAIASHAGKFVIALNEASVPAFERLSQYIPNLLGCRLALQPLSLDAAREMVRTEAARRGMEAEPGVTESLVNCTTVAFAGGVRPYLLMRGLTRLLDSEVRLASGIVRKSTLNDNGGADRLILESLDALLAELKITPAELLFRWYNMLMSPERRRVAVTEKGLTGFAGKYNRFVPTTLPLLMEIGILRQVETADALRYEIANDSLVPIVHDWWTRREVTLLARQRAQFRVRSVSVAAALLVAIYGIWLLLTLK
jgi:hypothetical protein